MEILLNQIFTTNLRGNEPPRLTRYSFTRSKQLQRNIGSRKKLRTDIFDIARLGICKQIDSQLLLGLNHGRTPNRRSSRTSGPIGLQKIEKPVDVTVDGIAHCQLARAIGPLLRFLTMLRDMQQHVG